MTKRKRPLKYRPKVKRKPSARTITVGGLMPRTISMQGAMPKAVRDGRVPPTILKGSPLGHMSGRVKRKR